MASKQDYLNALKYKKWIRSTPPPGGPSDCSICYMPFNEGKNLCTTTECGHHFCAECMLQWANSGRPMAHTCPMCREPMWEKELEVIPANSNSFSLPPLGYGHSISNFSGWTPSELDSLGWSRQPRLDRLIAQNVAVTSMNRARVDPPSPTEAQETNYSDRRTTVPQTSSYLARRRTVSEARARTMDAGWEPTTRLSPPDDNHISTPFLSSTQRRTRTHATSTISMREQTTAAGLEPTVHLWPQRTHPATTRHPRASGTRYSDESSPHMREQEQAMDLEMTEMLEDEIRIEGPEAEGQRDPWNLELPR